MGIYDNATFDDISDAVDIDSASTVDDASLGMATIHVPKDIVTVLSTAPSGQQILEVCIEVAAFLAAKNHAYGNSAIDPVRIFSKSSPQEQILVRMDDKISRIMRGTGYPGDNDFMDLLGYLVLYFVARKVNTLEKEGSSE